MKGDVITSLRDKFPFITEGKQYVVDRPHECTGKVDHWGNYVIWVICNNGGTVHLMWEHWQYSNGKCYKCRYDCKRENECEMFEEIK